MLETLYVMLSYQPEVEGEKEDRFEFTTPRELRRKRQRYWSHSIVHYIIIYTNWQTHLSKATCVHFHMGSTSRVYFVSASNFSLFFFEIKSDTIKSKHLFIVSSLMHSKQ
jgi:hypothetical protein